MMVDDVGGVGCHGLAVSCGMSLSNAGIRDGKRS